MLDSRSRVTVVGANKRVDLALPSHAPIGEYAAGLARMCGQATGGVLPPAWSLAAAGRPPIPVEMSLAEARVLDGQVLYLRDVGRSPDAAPVIEDIDEIVADEAQRLRGAGAVRGLAIMAFGLVWLTVTALLAVLRPGPGPLETSAVLTVAGLSALAIAWALHQLGTRVPAPLCLAVSLTTVPCLTAAGWLLGQALYGAGFRWPGAIVGANAGMVMVLATIPEAVILALELPLALAAVLAAVLSLVAADRVQAAAAVAVCALALISVARPLAGAIAAWSGKLPRSGPAVAQAVTIMLVRARQLLAVILAGPALALGATLPLLAATGQGYAVALDCVASVALLVRARRVGFTSEVVLLGGAGCAGLFAVAATYVHRYLAGGLAASALALAGLGVLGAGIALTVLRHPEPAAGEDPTLGLGGPVDNPDRLRWLDVVGMLCNIACASLAMGVFGVFDDLFGMGRHIVG
jgi:hypothetical protein